MALLLGLDIAVPASVIQAWVLNLYMVVVSRRQIAWAERIRIVMLAGIGLPFTVVGMVAGNLAHHRMDELLFRRIVYALLLATGLIMYVSG